jgi:hypothetical protein
MIGVEIGAIIQCVGLFGGGMCAKRQMVGAERED